MISSRSLMGANAGAFMDISFDFTRASQFFAIRFQPGRYESRPFVSQLRFWGVTRMPCSGMATLAALMALKAQRPDAVAVKGASLTPPVCTTLGQHFGVEVRPSDYQKDRANLLGGTRVLAPVRFGHSPGPLPDGAEALSWMSVDDLLKPLGAHVGTNLDAFDLDEAEKDLIVALCCGGKDLGHVLMDDAPSGMDELFHSLGMELVAPPATQ